MPIAMTRANKPARYGYKDGNMVMLPDEPVAAAAEPSPAIPSAGEVGLLTNLVALLANSDATKARISEFADMCGKARDAVEAAKKAAADKAAYDQAIAAAEAAHEKKMADERAVHEKAMSDREYLALGKEKDADDKHRQATRALDDANKLKARLQAKLDQINKVAAAAE